MEVWRNCVWWCFILNSHHRELVSHKTIYRLPKDLFRPRDEFKLTDSLLAASLLAILKNVALLSVCVEVEADWMNDEGQNPASSSSSSLSSLFHFLSSSLHPVFFTLCVWRPDVSLCVSMLAVVPIEWVFSEEHVSSWDFRQFQSRSCGVNIIVTPQSQRCFL